MLVHIPDHFSSSFKFNLSKLPTTKTDRSSLFKSVTGIVLGLLMLALSVFELYSFVNISEVEGESFFMVKIFAVIMIIVALGIVFCSFMSATRYKKYSFDGNKFYITYRPSLGIEHHIEENLSEYSGVRFRVLFTQIGILCINRYIIDLYHHDSNKIIPLYISFSSKNIRKIWEDYASFFKLPAISINERGIVKRNFNDLNKSIVELAKENKLPLIASGKLPNPKSVEIEETRNSTIIKNKLPIKDSFIFVATCVAICFLLVTPLIILDTDFKVNIIGMITQLLLGYIAFMTVWLVTYVLISPSINIEITNEKVYLKTTFFKNIERYKEAIKISELKDVVLSYNPKRDNYKLILVGDKKILSYLGKMPVKDFVWLKDFIIRKLIGN